MRLNKYISSTGFCSRRAAEQYILDGAVTINGQLAELNTPVEEGDKVCINGVLVTPMEKQIYIMLNKPVGITCTTERHIEGNIIDYVNHEERIFPIGRLDKDSSGLIILTNDGDIVNKTLREENGHSKEYEVSVDHKLTDEFLNHLRNGVKIYNPVNNSYVVTKPCQVKKINQRSFRITLTQGYNRQIRRMCSAYNYHVQSLKRYRFVNLSLGNLPVGKWRDLTAEEVAQLKKEANKSIK